MEFRGLGFHRDVHVHTHMDDLILSGIHGDGLAVIPGGLVYEADAFSAVGVGHHDVVGGGGLHIVVPAVLGGHDAAVDHIRALEIFREINVRALGGDSHLAGTGVAGINRHNTAVVLVLRHLFPVERQVDGGGRCAGAVGGDRNKPFGIGGDREIKRLVAVVGDGESGGGGLVVVDQSRGGGVQLAGIGSLGLRNSPDNESVITGFRAFVLADDQKTAGQSAESGIDAVRKVGVAFVLRARLGIPAVGVVAHLTTELDREQLLLAKVPGEGDGGEFIERRRAFDLFRTALHRLRVEGPGARGRLHGISVAPETLVEDQTADKRNVVGGVDLEAVLVAAGAGFAGLHLHFELNVVLVDVDRGDVEINAEVGSGIGSVLSAGQKGLRAALDARESLGIDHAAVAV